MPAATYKEGDYVEILEDNAWSLAYVMSKSTSLPISYNVQSMHDGRILSHRPKTMRPSSIDVDEETANPIDIPLPAVAGPSTSTKKRFGQTGSAQLNDLELAAKAQNTHRQTAWGVKIFKEWLVEVEENVDFELKSKEEVGILLKRFYADIRCKDGKEYGKKSLVCIRAAIQRHLNQPPYNVNYNIIIDPVFIAANNVLKGHIKKNKAAGLDVSTHYIPITKRDKELMYSSGTLSNDMPRGLQYKVYYKLTLHFGRRAREGLHDLKQKDIIFRRDSDGIEFATLAYNPKEKNHQGLSQGTEEHEQRMYATGKKDCPLSSLKLYLSKLTPSNEAFFQCPKNKGWRMSMIWYTKSAVGVNTIGKFMQAISKVANLSQIYSNHCVRATCVTTLGEKGVPSRDIKAVTGHKSEASIESYSKTSDDVRRAMSHTLGGLTQSQTVNESNVSVVNVQKSEATAPLFSNVTFTDCTVTINYN